jgi:release factor glutamine methyltransferase
MMTIGEVLHEAVSVLGEAGSPTPRLDAEVILAACLRIDRLQFYTHAEQEVTPEATEMYSGWIQRRIKGEPVSYIIGVKEFWSLPFHVSPSVLIPRPETEVLVEEVLTVIAEPREGGWQVLEIGVGSGAIAVALAVERKDIQVTATDLSGEALAVAMGNAERSGVKDRIQFLQADLFAPVTGQYDVIISNPPYISRRDFDLLPPGIRDYEPTRALLAGPEGTEFHRELIRQGAPFLKTGGWLLMEMGDGQGENIRPLFADHGGYEEIGIRCDYGGMERVIKARRK